MLTISALGKLRQEDFSEFQDNLSYRVRYYLKNNKHTVRKLKGVGDTAQWHKCNALVQVLEPQSYYHQRPHRSSVFLKNNQTTQHSIDYQIFYISMKKG